MAAKKDKSGVDALRGDIQALQESFWRFRDAMLTDAAVVQAEQQQQETRRLNPVSVDEIGEDELNESATLMAALGQPQRLRMAVMLAQNPVSVSEIVQQLGLKTTGSAYHHLNVLTSNGIVEQPQRGTFALTATQAPRVIELLEALFGFEPASNGEDDESKSKSGKKKKKS